MALGNTDGPNAKPCPGLRCRAQLGGFASPLRGGGGFIPAVSGRRALTVPVCVGLFLCLGTFLGRCLPYRDDMRVSVTNFWHLGRNFGGAETRGCCHHRELSLSSVFKGKFLLLLLSPPTYSWLLRAQCVSPGCNPVGCPGHQRD